MRAMSAVSIAASLPAAPIAIPGVARPSAGASFTPSPTAVPARRKPGGVVTRQFGLLQDHQGPRAVLNALERLAGGYGSECVRVRQDIAIAESQLRDYQARLGNPFPHETYLSELTELREHLKAGLSGTAHEPSRKEGPDVSELADRIKALKSAHSVEAAPQRARPSRPTAEEPITARIRRRQQADPASDTVIEAAPPAGPAVPLSSTQHLPGKPPMTFQERIDLERQQKTEGQTPD